MDENEMPHNPTHNPPDRNAPSEEAVVAVTNQSLDVTEANLCFTPEEAEDRPAPTPLCMALEEHDSLHTPSSTEQEQQPLPQLRSPPNYPTVSPYLSSGQEIDAKNTLRSNSVLFHPMATTSTPRAASPNLYKEMLGIGNAAIVIGTTATSGTTSSRKESTSSLFAESAISAIAYSSTAASPHGTATNDTNNATSVSATHSRAAVHPTSVRPVLPRQVAPVFASARFVENEACTDPAADVLPIQSLSPDSMTYVSHTNSRVSGLTETSGANAGGTQQTLSPQSKGGLRWGAVLVLVTVAMILGTVCGTGQCARTPRAVPVAITSSAADDNRVTAVAEWINRITFSGRTIAVVTDKSSKHELPEELALQWIIQDDPLALSPTNATSRFRLQQRYALYTLLAQMPRLDETSRNASPTASMDECEWMGVTCTTFDVDGEARNVVTTIALPSRQLSGSLPADLGLLKEVLHFDVSDNSMSGSLPQALNQWTRLETLHLGHNSGLAGSIPPSYGTQWTHLRNFTAPDNSLTGSIPSELDAWTLLVHFDAHRNRFNGTIPPLHWNNLEYFGMSNNELTGTIPAEIGEQWTNLKYFDLGWSGSHYDGQNRLTGTLPDALQQWKALLHFNVNWNSIKGTIPEWLRHWTSLEVFDVHQNIGFSGTLPVPCGEAWSSLRHFDVSANVLIGNIPESYAQWTHLEYLDASDNQLTGTLSASWAQWKKLRFFSLLANKLDGTIPHVLGSAWSNLKYIDIAVNRFKGSLPESMGNWTSLEFFSAGSNDLTGSLPESLGQWTALTTVFTVDHNGLIGTLPESIGQWSLLAFFSVAVNSLTGTIPDSIASWRHIEYAYFEANNFTDTMPEGICDTNVTELVADCAGEVSCSCCTSCNATVDANYWWGDDQDEMASNVRY